MELTPIEIKNNIYFKRDDLFRPFGNNEINGGKLRQGLCLIENNKDFIKNKCNNTIVTSSSVHSPQCLIISRIAKEYGFKSIIGVGGLKKEQVKNHYFLTKCIENGSDIRILAGHGMTSVLFKRCADICKSEGGFLVRFGINLENNVDAVLGSIANQVENIPDNLDKFIIPCGSGITMAGILYGIYKFKKQIKEVIGIGIGPDRSKKIKEILRNIFNYTGEISLLTRKFKFISLYGDKGFSYSKELHIDVDKELVLDPIYEAKSYDYFIKNLYKLEEKSLFWIVGNRKDYCEPVEYRL